MRPRAPHRCRTAALVVTALGICAAAHAQSAIDGFNPGANDLIWSFAVQADGKILAVGDFTTMGGGGAGTIARNRIARLNADGSLDVSFNPGADAPITSVAVQPDGKILVGGGFSMLGGGGSGTTARHGIGRLNADGSLDTTFNPNANSDVRAIVVQPDGKVLIAGAFTTIGAALVPRSKLARLNADGSLDPSFDPGADENVDAMVLQPNGQIVVGGFFLHLGGGGTGAVARNYIGRLNADGSLDAAFNPGAANYVFALARQPDGKIVAGGNFTGMGGGTGTTTRNRIARLNADGSLDTSFNPGATANVIAVAVQPDGKILVGGAFTGLGGGTGTTGRNRIGRLNPSGSVDTAFNPGLAGTSIFALAVQPDGKILAGGTFTAFETTARNNIGRLYASGSPDADFNPGANTNVAALALQPDGKIVVGGNFSGIGGGTGTTTRQRLARLTPTGAVESFNPGADGQILALAVQPDGAIIVGGTFTMLGGGGTGTTPRANIGRLNPDGTLDPSFNPGANNSVYAIAVQPDGQILIGGSFTTLGGSTRNYIGRLNADGSLDTSFNPGASNIVFAVALQEDLKILVGGNFTTLGGGGTGTTVRNRIGRLNIDGSLDTGFNPGADSSVNALATQADGRVLVGGAFTGLGGGTGTVARSHIGRVTATGTLDVTFNPGANNSVFSIAVQTDGKILLSGQFTGLGGGTGTTTRNRIGRVNADGSLDSSFDPGANGTVYALALQADGKVLVGGLFTTLGGGGTGTVTRNVIGRLTNTGAAAQALTVTAGGIAVNWARSGSGPEVSRVTFESSPDGAPATYTTLGNAARVPGGWRLAGLSLPGGTNLFIRARGYYAASYNNGSGAVVESIGSTLAVPCTYALASSSVSVPSGLNGGFVTLTTNDPSCPWTATRGVFTTVTPTSGSGTTAVVWVTSVNASTSPRTDTLTIAGLTYTLTQAGASTTRRVPNDFNHDALGDIAVFRPSTGRWYNTDLPNTDWGVVGDLPVPGDYNGDGNLEVAVFRPSNGTWYVNGGATVVWGLPGDIPVPGDYNGDHVTDMAVFRPSAGQFIVRNVGTFTWGVAGDLPVPADYNGDGITDIAVYRPSTGTWYVRDIITVVYGFAADVPVPADYNGDGTADIAVFRPATGTWYIKDQYSDTWGMAGDVPVPMDRSGDGIAELAFFRRSTGIWYFKNHLNGVSFSQLWGAPGDIPLGLALPPVRTLPGDFDGDRKADLTVFRPSTGDWVTARSLSGFTDYTTHTFGLSGDVPVARDYDGDGKIDPAVFRPSLNRWFMLRSSTGYADYVAIDLGAAGDIPVPGDYDGDGRADLAVFRPSLGRWLILPTSVGLVLSTDFGLSGDIPVPADYDGDGRIDIAVFRPSTGRWYIIYDRLTGAYVVADWGLPGDVPAPADFDGDGKGDLTVFRPSLGRWFTRSSIDAFHIVTDWGLSGDVMVPADFDGDGKADVAVFRPSTGFWYVRGQFNRSWGLAGDMSGIKIP